MLIAVLRPTRGLEFAESADSISRELEGFAHLDPKRTWDKAIPESFNYLAEWFFNQTQASHALFVEEDVVMPVGGLQAMLALDTDIAAINYHLRIDGRISQMIRKDKLLWVSLGCTLIKYGVFEKLPRPWFSTDYAITSKSTGSSCKEKIQSLEYNPRAYAGHDAYFCFNALQAGFTIGVVPGMLCEHISIESYGQPNVNDGCHKIKRI